MAESSTVAAPRFPDWEHRLFEYLSTLRGQPFEWGMLDCALFIGGAVLAMTGDDPVAEFRGRYTTERGAARVILSTGHTSIAEVVGTKFREVPVAFAHRGDIVLVDGGKGVALVFGAVALRPGDDQLGRPALIQTPRREWEQAWRVPMPGDGAAPHREGADEQQPTQEG